MDRDELADFLRRRREVLQPEDVGLQAGPRRRTSGLRREDVAALAGMSTDYYARLEQARGPHPSESILAAIARAMRLSQAERDYLFRVAGQTPPPRYHRSEHVSPALMRVLDRLDTPAQVVTDLGQTLVQNPMALALLGDQTSYTGHARSICFRWFTDPATPAMYPEDDHDHHAHVFASQVRAAMARHPDDPEIKGLVAALHEASPAFTKIWEEHEIRTRMRSSKRMIHHSVGPITLDCQQLTCEDDGQMLLVYTATPGSEDREKLDLLRVIGDQQFAPTES